MGKLVTNATGGTQPYSFQWSTGSTNADSLTGIVGPTRVAVTVTDNNGCSVAATDSILNTGSPTFKVLKVDSSCLNGNNGSIEIIPLSNDGPFSYVWAHDPSLTTAIAKNLAPGNYMVSAYNSFNCAQVINVTVPAFNGSFFDLGADQRIQLGQTAQIEVKTDAALKTITWIPDNVSVNDEKKYYTTPTTTTVYSATATYGKGCLFNDQMTIFVDTVESKLTVPTIFTPNGDGINDDFYVQYNGIKTFQIWIFDRWGAKVYESTDVDFRWNGKNSQSNNLEMDGNYGYSIEYSTYTQPAKQIINGYVTLVK
jgi:gliding motility-associated-like protein